MQAPEGANWWSITRQSEQKKFAAAEASEIRRRTAPLQQLSSIDWLQPKPLLLHLLTPRISHAHDEHTPVCPEERRREDKETWKRKREWKVKSRLKVHNKFWAASSSSHSKNLSDFRFHYQFYGNVPRIVFHVGLGALNDLNHFHSAFTLGNQVFCSRRRCAVLRFGSSLALNLLALPRAVCWWAGEEETNTLFFRTTKPKLTSANWMLENVRPFSLAWRHLAFFVLFDIGSFSRFHSCSHSKLELLQFSTTYLSHSYDCCVNVFKMFREPFSSLSFAFFFAGYLLLASVIMKHDKNELTQIARTERKSIRVIWTYTRDDEIVWVVTKPDCSRFFYTFAGFCILLGCRAIDQSWRASK